MSVEHALVPEAVSQYPGNVSASPMVHLSMSRQDLACEPRKTLHGHHVLARSSGNRHHEVKKSIGTLRLPRKVGAARAEKTDGTKTDETDVHFGGEETTK